MRRKRFPLRLLWLAALVAIVAALAFLQYQWLGQVSEAEHDRLQASLRQRAGEFADDFDREITRIDTTFQVNGAELLAGDTTEFVSRYAAWRDSTQAPGLIAHIYLLDADAPDQLRVYQGSRGFVAASWPDALDAVRKDYSRPVALTPAGFGNSVFALAREPIVASVPAVRLTLTSLGQPNPGEFLPRMRTLVLIVELDRAYIQSTFLPMLANRYFAEHGIDSYRFAVVDVRDGSRTIFARGVAEGSRITGHADATADLFTVRPDDVKAFSFTRQPSGTGRLAASNENITITTDPSASAPAASPTATMSRSVSQFGVVIEQHMASNGSDITRTNVRAAATAPWQLVLQHSSGSLETAVAGVRRRDAFVSFGILAILGLSVGLVIVNADRARQLAAQQMDFVATVSHELRTPLAVIRSAAQNLSAGVVSDAPQAKRYGDLIEAEGRRLTDMVEQVLEYAGLSSPRRTLNTQPVDLGVLVEDVASSCDALFQSAGVTPEIRVDENAAIALVDESALRRAVQNLVTNALKYGAEGGWIGLTVRRAAGGAKEVEIDVSDRGAGIDAADLPHVFESFYRGQRARDRQIHGNGLGLSLVKRIVEAHGGRVTLRSSAETGTTFTLHVPAAPPEAVVEFAAAAMSHGSAAS